MTPWQVFPQGLNRRKDTFIDICRYTEYLCQNIWVRRGQGAPSHPDVSAKTQVINDGLNVDYETVPWVTHYVLQIHAVFRLIRVSLCHDVWFTFAGKDVASSAARRSHPPGYPKRASQSAFQISSSVHVL